MVLILGANFGYETDTGESVTQQEFRRAKTTGKPILAFLQTVEMEERQRVFSREVSDYDHEARLDVAFLPQPETLGTLRAAHAQHDPFFLKLCQAGLGSIKGGYKDFDSAYQTGIDTPDVKWRHHESGLCWSSISLANASAPRGIMDSYSLSPSRVRAGAEAAFGLLCDGKSGWFQISLTGVDHQLLAEPPASSSNSVSLPFRSEQKLEERSLLIPPTPAAYRHWLDEVMFRFERKMSM